jgi:glutamyl-tRNA reductase
MHLGSTIWLFGVCHRSAPADVRARVAYDDDAALRLLGSLRRVAPDVEGLVLSTCNRNEVYLAGPEGRDLAGDLQRAHGDAFADAAERIAILRAHARRGDDAVTHLVRVACGLESAVLADAQVIGQLRRAVDVASRAGTLGPALGKATALALRAGRRVRRETPFGRSGSGVGRVIADRVHDHLQRLGPGDRTVLLVGAGHFATAAAVALRSRIAARILVTNRSPEGAARLASRVGGDAVAWDAWRTVLGHADVVVCATAAPAPLLRQAEIDAARRAGGCSLVVDAGLPPNVDAPHGPVVAIDMLAAGAAPEVAAAVPAVCDIVSEATAAWQEWQATRWVDDCVRTLYEDATDAISAIVDELRARSRPAPEVERVVTRRVRALADRQARSVRALGGAALGVAPRRRGGPQSDVMSATRSGSGMQGWAP